MVHQKIYDLRYIFEYSDNTPPMIGKWNYSSSDPKSMAAFAKRRGLSRVKVESKNIYNGERKIIVDSPHDIFRQFRWLCVSFVNPLAISPHKDITPQAHHVGLEMWLADEKVIILNSGRIVREPLSEDDKNYNFATYGR